MTTPTDALPQGVPPPTEAELLAAYTKAMLAHARAALRHARAPHARRPYTKAMLAHARAAHELFALNAQLEATVKNHTRTLKAALTKILRGTAWRMESAKYWLGIDHAVRPVASLLHVSIVIERFGRGKGRAEVRYNFAPAVQAEVLAEIERLVA